MMEREEPGELQLNGSPSTGQDEYCCQDTAQRECDSDNICLFAVRSGKLRVLDCFPLASLAACANGADAANLLRLKLQGSLPAGSDWMLRIPPIGIDGFDVILRSCLPRASIRVNFGGLEELLETLDAALVWVGRALSASYQLRTTSFGGCARMWRLERIDPSAGGRARPAFPGIPARCRVGEAERSLLIASDWRRDWAGQDS